MNLLTSVLLPLLERQLREIEPELAEFVVEQLKLCGSDLVNWAEKKLNMDLNRDGLIGGEKHEG